jgi:hypothetical protein
MNDSMMQSYEGNSADVDPLCACLGRTFAAVEDQLDLNPAAAGGEISNRCVDVCLRSRRTPHRDEQQLHVTLLNEEI